MIFTLKKKISLCLAIVMLLSLLVGCHEDVEMASGTPSIDFESQAHIQVGTSEDDTSMPTEESQPPLTGDFVVNQKKYDYKGNNIQLLHVENQTNRHFDISIKGKYLDKDGKVIKEETQEFAAFPAGWSNYFIFYPECAFDSFTYVLETEEYTKEVLHSYGGDVLLATDSDGNPLASYINMTYEKKLTWDRAVLINTRPYSEGRGLYLYSYLNNSHPDVAIGVNYHVLILDTDGNIYITDCDFYDQVSSKGSQSTSANPAGIPTEGHDDCILTQQHLGEDESIPDNVQGVFTVIFAITDVYDYEDFQEKGRLAVGN